MKEGRVGKMLILTDWFVKVESLLVGTNWVA